MRLNLIISALVVSTMGACTLADEQPLDDTSEVESAATKTGSTSGPTCAATTDYMSDANNCGVCGNVCGSGLCYSGTCSDATAGHVFVIGHGYETSNLSLDKLLGNAVFLNERKPVRILAYQGTAPAQYVTGTDAAIARQGTARGRTFTTTKITSSADVAAKIGAADVFLVYAQPQQTSTALNYLGEEWALSLANFARGGGVIVVLDTASSNVGTADVLTRTGLMTLTGRANAASNAYVGQADDVVSARVPLMFATTGSSVAWTASTSYKNVATNDSGKAIVVHRAMY